MGRQFCASLIHGLSKYISKFFRCSCTVQTWSKKRKKWIGKLKRSAERGSQEKKVFTNQVLRAHPGSNWGPIDLQSIALPLSYTPEVRCSRFIPKGVPKSIDMTCLLFLVIPRPHIRPAHIFGRCSRSSVSRLRATSCRMRASCQHLTPSSVVRGLSARCPVFPRP